MIIPLQWAVHMNSDLWHDPYKYEPGRFLDGDGKFCAPSAFIPFQTGNEKPESLRVYVGMYETKYFAGKRMCLGEELAKMLLFLFCSNILYNFKLHYTGVEPVEKILGECGITLTPPRHKIQFHKIC